MNTHLEPQIRHSGVTNLANRPTITYDSLLAVANLDVQSAALRINRGAPNNVEEVVLESNVSQEDSPFAPPKASLKTGEEEAYDVGTIFTLKGRFGRVDYIVYSIGMTLIVSLLSGLLAMLLMPVSPQIAGFGNLVMMIPVMVLSVVFMIRRLHDMNWRGWWVFTVFIPLLNIIPVFMLMFMRGTDGENRYGLPRPPPSTFKIVIALILPAVFIVGILAAIAIPAYQDYLLRAQGG
ncbi:hypothetical protein MNBD_GAMMA17-295 [hydrothermal vent metagenome]|uniref:DUF805 domain-containing protein n=1 Tax=hydrothermal vent metagenome TaxID=652676 RepID=A0A3B0Z0G4_9ZZZZ